MVKHLLCEYTFAITLNKMSLCLVVVNWMLKTQSALIGAGVLFLLPKFELLTPIYALGL